MLLMLAQSLAQDIRGFSVFNYITLREGLAGTATTPKRRGGRAGRTGG